MVAKRRIAVRGQVFNSIAEAAEHFGQSVGNVGRRLRSGWSIEEAVGVARKRTLRPSQGVQVRTSQGTFPSIQEAAKHFGIEPGTLQNRLAKGWPPDHAVGLVKRQRKPKTTSAVTYDGKVYPNSWNFARAFNKNEKLVAKRLRSGWSPEQAVDLVEAPPRFRNQIGGATNKHWKRVEIVDNTEYPATDVGNYKLYVIRNSVDSKEYIGITINPLWMRFNGHKRSARTGVKTKLYNSMRLHGAKKFTIELIRSDARSFAELQKQEAAEISRRDTIRSGYNVSPGGGIGTPTSIKVGNLVFPSRGAAAEYFGVDSGVFNLRISRLGWTPEQAAEVELREKYSRHKVTVLGRSYGTLQEAATALGVNYRLAWSRIKSKGWTIEQALGAAASPDRSKFGGIAIEAYGQSFRSYAACAREFGVGVAAFRQRVSSLGEEAEFAITHLRAAKKRRMR